MCCDLFFSVFFFFFFSISASKHRCLGIFGFSSRDTNMTQEINNNHPTAPTESFFLNAFNTLYTNHENDNYFHYPNQVCEVF